jgi:Zn-finger nucleic acid-binding protein
MIDIHSMQCPRCGKPLTLEKDPRGGMWRCAVCSGVAANLTVLRRHLEADVVRDFWRKAVDASTPSGNKCPSCSRPFREFVVRHEDRSLRLDLCRQCQLMWFDRGELETFPESTAPEPPHPERPTPSEIDWQLALLRLKAKGAMNEDVDRFANYVDVGLNVLMVLLRLFLRLP